MSSPLVDLAVRRQMLLERLKAGQVRDFTKAFAEIEKAILRAFGGVQGELSGQGKRYVAKFLKEAEKVIAAPLTERTKLYMAELEPVAGLYAAAESIDLLKSVRGLKGLTIPKPSAAWKRALENPMSHSGETLSEFVESFGSREAKRVLSQIRLGAAQGRTNAEIIRSVIGTRARNYKDGILAVSRRNADAMVRTATQHAASTGRQALWEANADVVGKYAWVSTLDRNTTTICKSLDGQEWELGKGPTPPIHIRCLTEGTLITSACAISRVFKRAHKGKIIRIRSGLGNEIAVTPNHPILTNRGWVPAQFVNVGDKCFIHPDSKGVKNPEGENDTVYATIEQVAEAFGGFPQVTSREVPTSAPDFHGDTLNGEIANILAKDDLGFILYAPKVKHGGKVGFVFGDREAATFYPAPNGGGDAFGREALSPSGFIGLFGQLFSSGLVGAVHPGLLLSRAVPQDETMLAQDSLNGTWTDAEGLRDAPDADSGGVVFDNVIGVQVEDFCGHVYNLETHDHLIKCNGIVTHNCRSTTIAVLNSQFDFLKQGRTRSAEFGPVAGGETYYDWLKAQPESVQNEALGPTRGKLFRDGGLSADEFATLQLDKNFKPLTLAEMRALEPEAFQAAGL